MRLTLEKVRSVAEAAPPLVKDDDGLTPCPVPSCGGRFRKVDRHIYDKAKAGDDSHIQWRLDNPKRRGRPAGNIPPASPVPPVPLDLPPRRPESVAAGRVASMLLVSAAGQYYDEVKVPASPLDMAPGSVWLEEFAVANQELLLELFPEGLDAHKGLIAWSACVGQFVMVNGLSRDGKIKFISNGADNRPEGEGKDESSEVAGP